MRNSDTQLSKSNHCHPSKDHQLSQIPSKPGPLPLSPSEQPQASNTDKQENNECLFKQSCGMKVWQLRHLQVSTYIDKHAIHSILDIGCSDGKLIQRLSRSTSLTLLTGIDIDLHLLKEETQTTVTPEMLQNDLEFFRKEGQVVELYQADALKKYQQLKNKKHALITAVEVIEHLHLEQVDAFTQNLFGYLQPLHLIITTPNKDFNYHFKFKQGEMRHWDHKFQWTRTQFLSWASQTATKYHYQLSISGAGQHHKDSSHGFCSQIALFQRKHQQIHTYLPDDVELVPVAKFNNKCWKDNLEYHLSSACYNCLSMLMKDRDGCELFVSWEELLRSLESQKVGKHCKSSGIDITPQMVQGVIKGTRFVCGEEGVAMKDEEQEEDENEEEGENDDDKEGEMDEQMELQGNNVS